MHVVIGIDLWLYLYFLCFYLAILVCMSFVCQCMYIAAVQKNGFSRVLSLNYIQINQPMIGSQCVTGETKIWQGDSLPCFGY